MNGACYSDPRTRAQTRAIDTLTMRAAIFWARPEAAVITRVALGTAAFAGGGITQASIRTVIRTALGTTRWALVLAATHARAVGAHTMARALIVAVPLRAHERCTVGVDVETQARTISTALACAVDAFTIAKAVTTTLLVLACHTFPATLTLANQLIASAVLTAVIWTRAHGTVEASPVGITRTASIFIAHTVVRAVVGA